jgi:hypothetical protein
MMDGYGKSPRNRKEVPILLETFLASVEAEVQSWPDAYKLSIIPYAFAIALFFSFPRSDPILLNAMAATNMDERY